MSMRWDVRSSKVSRSAIAHYNIGLDSTQLMSSEAAHFKANSHRCPCRSDWRALIVHQDVSDGSMPIDCLECALDSLLPATALCESLPVQGSSLDKQFLEKFVRLG
jgi:hypothetical protein